ncbi:MAG TPA: PEP/pyruvate-binding domain-containing protein [Actinomycetota bacterium]|jgi:pyruvate,water dikinase|nr:PEP/pyruvate-binding domain-containing protein [Actinomycetota bacterium]
MPAPLVLPFRDPRCRQVALAGGKGASLATMTAEDLPVPPGFVIASTAFEATVDTDALRELMRGGDVEAARAMVATAEPPKEPIERHYAELTGLVAVRSSACAEDSEAASYAGQQETYLNTDGLAEVLANVVRCWLSFFTERAVFYRREKGSMDDVAMAVVVQQMVDSQKSGVLFTVDPVHGRRDRMVVEAARGLGEAVVSGEVTPDNYTLSRDGAVKKSRVVGAERVLSDADCAALAALGRQVADLHGGPQDIEWAFDADGGLFLLQSRPITTI